MRVRVRGGGHVEDYLTSLEATLKFVCVCARACVHARACTRALPLEGHLTGLDSLRSPEAGDPGSGMRMPRLGGEQHSSSGGRGGDGHQRAIQSLNHVVSVALCVGKCVCL